MGGHVELHSQLNLKGPRATVMPLQIFPLHICLLLMQIIDADFADY